MFKLIQRGQIFADRHGWPVIIEGVRKCRALQKKRQDWLRINLPT